MKLRSDGDGNYPSMNRQGAAGRVVLQSTGLETALSLARGEQDDGKRGRFCTPRDRYLVSGA